MNREILRLALPSIVSNITVPLLALVDIAIVGHMGSAAFLGAISVGAMIFNVLYWLMAFLRMGTSGRTAQAYGRKDDADIRHHFFAGLSRAIFIGCVFLAFFWPLRELAVLVMQVNEESVDLVRTYFNICILGAPAALASFSLNGWLIGMQNTRIPMRVAIVQNIVNIILSLLLVYRLHMQIEGVALGTMISQWVAAVMLFLYARPMLPKARGGRKNPLTYFRLPLFTSHSGGTTNLDIFLRTLCLVSVNLYFTSAGSAQGTTILAVNTLLMTFFTMFSYFLDGFAFAGEALAGRFYGAGDEVSLHALHRNLLLWGLAIVVVFTLVYGVGGDAFLRLLTSDEAVIYASHDYRYYSLLIPAAGVLAFVYDGIFIGLMRTREMLLSCFVGAVAFFGIWLVFSSSVGNDALWTGLLGYLLLRGLVLSFLFRRCTNS